MWPFSSNLDTLDIPAEVSRLVSEELETRESSYTDALVSALQRNAQGRTANPAAPTATAALETCVGLVGRAFAAAEVGGPENIASALTPALMTMIGRSLIRRGEIVFAIDTSSGRLQLFPAQSHNVAGGHNPDTWEYELTLPGPSETMTLSLPAESVLHLRYAVDPELPYRGIGPLQVATLAGELSAETVKALGDEASGPRGSWLPLPATDGDDDSVAEIKAFVPSAAGRMGIVESVSDSFGTGGPTPQGDYKQQRFGPTPPAAMVDLMAAVKVEIYSACGIPPGLYTIGAAASIRESWRLCLFSTIGPLGRIVLTELRDKLDASLTVGWVDLRASDLQGRARAFQSLITGGMALADAVQASGVLADDD